MTRALVVMAAGLGTRYGGDKQIEGVGPGGEALFEYAVFDARRSGFTRIVFVVRDAIRDAIAAVTAGFPADLDVRLAPQRLDDVPAWFSAPPRARPWGTAQAVLAARAAVDTPFAVVNADDFYGAQAYVLAAEAAEEAARTGEHAIVGLRLDRTLSEHGAVARGIPAVTDGRLRTLEEGRAIRRTEAGIVGRVGGTERVLAGDTIASMNCWVFAPAIFDGLRARFEAFLRARGHEPDAELALPEAINDLIGDGSARVTVREAPGPWFGLTHRADVDSVRAGLRALVDAGVYPDPLWGAGGRKTKGSGV
jgi:UTP-glucose-1-phosphate uridylyltransferase